MRVTELILDGFKSYPVRTSISGWDGSFNAITGLNGSGKSNILDAICFVLGITNLTTVRASNLLDLIYKRGQAGVTRASVTIVFDNSDKSNAPVGFEHLPEISVTRQIFINGTSKYLICGHRSTQSAVQNLFQSVGLNINNPNFLIMQGKITKVLNMRPPEILSMIEEAAGTSMFEEKKDKAVKTMSKKEKKLEEIQEILSSEIKPKLDKLREEKRTFLEFQKTQTELERISKLVIAYDWTQLEAKKTAGTDQVKELEAQIAVVKESKKRMKDEIAAMQKEIKEIEKRRDRELAKGGKIEKLKEQQKDHAMQLSKLEAQVDIVRKDAKDEELKAKEVEAAAKELATQKVDKAKALEQLDKDYAQLKDAHDAAAAALKTSEDLLQSLLTGLSSSSEEVSSGFMGQLSAAKQKATSHGTDVERAKTKIEHLKKELKEKEPKAKRAETDGKGLIDELAQAKKDVAALEKSMAKLDWDEEKTAALRDRRDAENVAMRELLEKKDELKSQLASLDFEFNDPYKGFDRSKVKGLVANLVNIDDKYLHAAQALEVCAGGRLYNVVVDDENTGSAILQKGGLRKRVTIIPLSKIEARRASKEQLSSAKKLSKGTDLALSLVGYDLDVSKAMEFVFANTLICPDAASANLVTFNKEVRMRSVTLDGDVYDPSGTLSGGSKSSGTGVLVKVQKLKAIEAELSEHRVALDAIEKEWAAAKDRMDRYKKTKNELELRRHAVSLLDERVGESDATRIVAEVVAIKSSIVELTQSIDEAKQKQKAAQDECKRIEKEMAEFKNNRGSKLEQLKTDVKKKKTELQKQSVAVKTMQREVQTATLELEQMETDATSGQAEIEEARSNVAKSKDALAKLERSVKERQAALSSVESQIAEETKMLTAFDDELDALDQAIKGKESEMSDADLKASQIESDVDRMRKEHKAAVDAVAKLEKQYGWISDEKGTFGKDGSPYNFRGVAMNDCKKRCRQLEEEQASMRRKVNPRVMNMIEGVEKREKELMTMYRQVLKDKSKIEETVAKLDEYKREALQKTWEVVDVEFGKIFGELLPGNTCKLVVPEGMDITEGLEVKVRLGQAWKASLTELSGGQRSLIALSLIMALLHFKPAPMYILDEIDAALDLSHTENIGRLFRTRFKGSQFIVISLKEGLFAHASVLFKAKFSAGTSVIERSARGK